MDRNQFRERFEEKLETLRGVLLNEASTQDCYEAIAALTMEQITRKWVRSNKRNRDGSKKEVYYFSLEFMLGPSLQRNLQYLGIEETVEETVSELGFSMSEIYATELDPGLGNGGLGRLAACYMDSMAFLGIAGNGCSIRYKYGLFEQKIINGYQVEQPDNWLRDKNPWEIRKNEKSVLIKYYGNIHSVDDLETGRKHFIHENYEAVKAVPYDVPMPGSGENSGTVNTLRLWSAESINQFDFRQFSDGNYLGAAENKYSAEAISEVLYPDDSNYTNRVLRLKQQYFFVSAGLQSIIRHYKKRGGDLKALPEKISIHINDTHPALAVPELMRILMDDEGFGWEEAWNLTMRTISYTNHTIMPEALEKWSVDLYSTLLPRIYMITHEINERWCRALSDKYNYPAKKISELAIEAFGEIRMAYLAIVGSHSINGVAKVHSELLKRELFRDFYAILPERFCNVTNGVTQRRWVRKANPGLSSAITDAIGSGWVNDMKQLTRLDSEGFVNKPEFLSRLAEVKRREKEKLAKIIYESTDIAVNPSAIFDVQVKRIHAYKRQLLNVLNIYNTYNELLENPAADIVPRVFVFAGKAAPSYRLAKDIIKLINSLAVMINNDKRIRDSLKVVFLENYRVSLAERIFPASDVSEQISTASKEASGTGNMKFMMNGAVTIGTLDGANIEIFEAVGEGNYVQFGMTVEEVLAEYRKGTYNSEEVCSNDPRLKKIITQLQENAEFQNVYDSLITYNDDFFVLKDFDSYVNAQKKIEALYRDTFRWRHISAMNIAYSGKFSSDESIREYAKHIWRV